MDGTRRITLLNAWFIICAYLLWIQWMADYYVVNQALEGHLSSGATRNSLSFLS